MNAGRTAHAFVETLVRGDGLYWMACGAAIRVLSDQLLVTYLMR